VRRSWSAFSALGQLERRAKPEKKRRLKKATGKRGWQTKHED
jgi:hypothetical protein